MTGGPHPVSMSAATKARTLLHPVGRFARGIREEPDAKAVDLRSHTARQ